MVLLASFLIFLLDEHLIPKENKKPHIIQYISKPYCPEGITYSPPAFIQNVIMPVRLGFHQRFHNHRFYKRIQLTSLKKYIYYV